MTAPTCREAVFPIRRDELADILAFFRRISTLVLCFSDVVIDRTWLPLAGFKPPRDYLDKKPLRMMPCRMSEDVSRNRPDAEKRSIARKRLRRPFSRKLTLNDSLNFFCLIEIDIGADNS